MAAGLLARAGHLRGLKRWDEGGAGLRIPYIRTLILGLPHLPREPNTP